MYDCTIGMFYRANVRRTIELVNAQEGERVLEIGIGTGITIPFYCHRKQVHGIDPSGAMLRKAQKKLYDQPDLSVTLSQTRVEELASEEGRYDLVVFCSSLSVVRNPKQVLQKCFEDLKVGGSIYILNHFTPTHGPLYYLDKMLIPVGKLLGFQSFFLLSQVINPAMKTTVIKSGYWNIVLIRKSNAS